MRRSVGGPGLSVLTFPTFHGASRYGPALVESLQQEGVAVAFISEGTRFFPLRAVLRRDRLPRIVHLHWIDIYTMKGAWWKSLFCSAYYIFGLLVLKVLGIKIVWTVHDRTDPEGRHSRLDMLVRRLTAKLADAMTVHTEAARQEIEAL